MRILTAVLTTVLLGTAAVSATVRQARHAGTPAAEKPLPSTAEIEGTWTITRHENGLQMNIQWNDPSNWGRSVVMEDLQGLSAAQVASAVTTPVTFRIDREAGVFSMEGVFHEGRGAGHFRFAPNRGFPGTLASLGVRGTDAITDRELMHLALADASAARVREFMGLLEPFDAEALIELSIHGVTPTYVRGLREVGISGTNTVRGVVELWIHQITVDYIRELEGVGYRDLDRRQLLEMGIHGVSAEQVRGLRALGYTDLTARQLVNMRIFQVTPEYIRHMREGGFTDLTPEGLVELRIHSVTPEYVRALAELGYRNLSRATLLQMGIHGVTPAFIREMREAGFADLPAETLVRMKIHGIDAGFVRDARQADI